MRHFATIKRRLKPAQLISTVALVVFLCVLAPGLKPLEQNLALPLLFKARGAIPPPENIVIISINSQAAEHMQLPGHTGNWPRTVYADLIRRLKNAQAELLVMDIAFKDKRTPEEDRLLAEAIREAGNVILFKYLKRYQLSVGAGILDVEEEIFPIEEFRQNALATGSFTLPKHPARVIRSQVTTHLSSGDELTQPALTYLALIDKRALTHSPEEKVNAFKEQFIGLSKHLHLNFFGPPATLKTYNIANVLNWGDAQLNKTFAGKVVYVGFADPRQTEQRDAYRTVFSNEHGVDLSGVEISATAFANLVQKNYLRPPPLWIYSLLPALLLGAIALCYRMPLYSNISVQLTGFAAYSVMAYYAFASHYQWWPLVTPLITILFINGFISTFYFLAQKSRIGELRLALGQYLPDKAAQTLGKTIAALEQQQELVHGVCLVTDIKGYTALSESLPPLELHQLMNRYYADLIKIVQNEQGFIGNIVGDSLLALWTGAKITPEMCEQAYNAVQKILAVIDNNVDFRETLPTCIALHGGQFSLGNLGAQGHFEFSPVGDMINTATRVEHYNRNLGTQFLCTQPIAEVLQNNKNLEQKNIKLTYLGDYELRNKAQKTALYTHSQSTDDEH